jgi:hypothetical protein
LTVLFDMTAGVLEDLAHQLDVEDRRHVAQPVPARCEQRRDHLLEDGVLGSEDTRGSLEPGPSVHHQLGHRERR